jgi:hypothetical protein
MQAAATSIPLRDHAARSRASGGSKGLQSLSMVAAASSGAALGKLGKAFKKPTGALTISFQVAPINKMTEVDLDMLSTCLRKAKAAALFADDLEVVAALAQEQARAKTDFPGSCPVIASGKLDSASDVQAAIDAKASGIVIALGSLGLSKSQELCDLAKHKVEVIWHVQNQQEATQAAEAGAKVVLVSGEGLKDASAVRVALPKDSVVLAALEAMQGGAMEVEQAQTLKAAG